LDTELCHLRVALSEAQSASRTTEVRLQDAASMLSREQAAQAQQQLEFEETIKLLRQQLVDLEAKSTRQQRQISERDSSLASQQRNLSELESQLQELEASNQKVFMIAV
jgi:chromosome segregation ATPase